MSEAHNDLIREDLNDPAIEITSIDQKGGSKWIDVTVECTEEEQLEDLLPDGYIIKSFLNFAGDGAREAKLVAPVL